MSPFSHNFERKCSAHNARIWIVTVDASSRYFVNQCRTLFFLYFNHVRHRIDWTLTFCLWLLNDSFIMRKYFHFQCIHWFNGLSVWIAFNIILSDTLSQMVLSDELPRKASSIPSLKTMAHNAFMQYCVKHQRFYVNKEIRQTP